MFVTCPTEDDSDDGAGGVDDSGADDFFVVDSRDDAAPAGHNAGIPRTCHHCGKWVASGTRLFNDHLTADFKCPNVPAPAPGSRAGTAGSLAAGATPNTDGSGADDIDVVGSRDDAAPSVAAPLITAPVSSTSVAVGASGARDAVNLEGAVF